MFGQLSGSQGNTTASRNRFGSYTRNRVMPVDPSSSKQLALRNDVQELSQQWRGLTQDQRNAWIALAATIPKTGTLGETYFQTGLQLYTANNITRRRFGQADVAEAPTYFAPGALLTLSLTAVSGIDALSAVFTTTPIGADNRLIIEATRAVSAGINFMPRSEFKAVLYSAADATSAQNILAAWEAIYGSIDGTTAKKIFIRARIVNGGFFQGANLGASAIVS